MVHGPERDHGARQAQVFSLQPVQVAEHVGLAVITRKHLMTQHGLDALSTVSNSAGPWAISEPSPPKTRRSAATSSSSSVVSSSEIPIVDSELLRRL